MKIDELLIYKPQRGSTDSKIIFLDIETAPSLGYVWGKWE